MEGKYGSSSGLIFGRHYPECGGQMYPGGGTRTPVNSFYFYRKKKKIIKENKKQKAQINKSKDMNCSFTK